MTKGIFITATDTEIGKTFVSFLIARAFLAGGIKTSVFKPVAAGGKKQKGKIISPDVSFLKKNLNLTDSYEDLNPVCLKLPLSPLTASRIERKNIDIKKVLRSYWRMRDKYDFLVVEGIGGVNVPITKDLFVTDLIREIGYPVVVVTRPSLGTINHTLLTINELKRSGASIAGIVVNYCERIKKGAAEKTNPAIIQELSGIPIISELPFINNVNSPSSKKIGEKLYSLLKKA